MIASFTSCSITHDGSLVFLICIWVYYCIVLCIGIFGGMQPEFVYSESEILRYAQDDKQSDGMMTYRDGKSTNVWSGSISRDDSK